jgi:hypothetical protein
MCVFGGIAGALGAAAVACAMVGSSQAEPVSYQTGDIVVTRLDAPTEESLLSSRIDRNVLDANQSAIASVERPIDFDDFALQAATNRRIDADPESAFAMPSFADVDLLRVEGRNKAMQFPDTTGMPAAPLDSIHPTLIPLPAAVWTGATTMTALGAIRILSRRRATSSPTTPACGSRTCAAPFARWARPTSLRSR